MNEYLYRSLPNQLGSYLDWKLLAKDHQTPELLRSPFRVVRHKDLGASNLVQSDPVFRSSLLNPKSSPVGRSSMYFNSNPHEKVENCIKSS